MKTVWTIGALSCSVIGFGVVSAWPQTPSRVIYIDDPPPFSHRIKGDIDGDGLSNILVLHVIGDLCGPAAREPEVGKHRSTHADWPLSAGGGVTEGQTVGNGPWEIMATGDFDGDGAPDLLWQELEDTLDENGSPRDVRVAVDLTLT